MAPEFPSWVKSNMFIVNIDTNGKTEQNVKPLWRHWRIISVQGGKYSKD